MVFEKFTSSGLSYKPKVSIRSSGQIGFNYAAIKKFRISDHTYVVAYCDRENKRIGFRFTNDENEEGIYRLQNREKSSSFSGKSFLDYYEIQYSKTQRYDAGWDDKDSILVIDLKDQKKR